MVSRQNQTMIGEVAIVINRVRTCITNVLFSTLESVLSFVGRFTELVLRPSRIFLKIDSVCRATPWQAWLLSAVSILVIGAHVYARPYILYDDSDPLTYVRDAWAILGIDGGHNSAIRGPGYPLLLIATGMAGFDTWWGIIPVQILMAIAMPLLVYGALSPVNRNAGLAAGLMLLASAIPQHHVLWIMSETLFLFLQFLFFMLAARFFFYRKGLNTLLFIVVVCALLTMTRSAGMMYFWIFVFVAMALRFQQWRMIAKAATVYVLIMLSWTTYDNYTGHYRFPTLNNPANVIEQNFASAYYADPNKHFEVIARGPFDRDKGPASEALYQLLLEHVSAKIGTFTSLTSEAAEELFNKYTDPEELTERMLYYPHVLYFREILSAANFQSDGRTLLNDVAAEYYSTGFFRFAKEVLSSPRSYFFGPPAVYVKRAILTNFNRGHEMRAARNWIRTDFNKFPLSPENGPWTQKMFDVADTAVDMLPDYFYLNSNGYTELFKTPEEFKAYFRDMQYLQLSGGRSVTGTVEGDIYIAATHIYGEENAEKLMGGVLVELLQRYPLGGYVFFENFLRGTLLYHRIFDADELRSLSWIDLRDYLYNQRQRFTSATTVLPNPLGAAFEEAIDWTPTHGAIHVFMYEYVSKMITKPIFFLFSLFFLLPLLMDRNTRPITAVIFLCYAYSIAGYSAVIGNWDEPRYEDNFLIMPAMVSLLGFWHFGQLYLSKGQLRLFVERLRSH